MLGLIKEEWKFTPWLQDFIMIFQLTTQLSYGRSFRRVLKILMSCKVFRVHDIGVFF